MTKTEVIQILALLRTAFPNTRIEAETTVNLWYSLYHDVDFEIAKKATEHIIRTNKFFPTHYDFGEALRRVEYLAAIPEPKRQQLPAHAENTVEDILAEVEGMWKE